MAGIVNGRDKLGSLPGYLLFKPIRFELGLLVDGEGRIKPNVASYRLPTNDIIQAEGPTEGHSVIAAGRLLGRRLESLLVESDLDQNEKLAREHLSGLMRPYGLIGIDHIDLSGIEQNLAEMFKSGVPLTYDQVEQAIGTFFKYHNALQRIDTLRREAASEDTFALRSSDGRHVVL